MLVLSRYPGEEILIGPPHNQIVVAVMEVRGDKVRIGVQADLTTPIHRREVWEAIQREEGGQQ